MCCDPDGGKLIRTPETQKKVWTSGLMADPPFPPVRGHPHWHPPFDRTFLMDGPFKCLEPCSLASWYSNWSYVPRYLHDCIVCMSFCTMRGHYLILFNAKNDHFWHTHPITLRNVSLDLLTSALILIYYLNSFDLLCKRPFIIIFLFFLFYIHIFNLVN